MKYLIPLIVSIILSLLFTISLFAYINMEKIKKQENFKAKLDAIFSNDKKDLVLVLLSITLGIIFFCIGYFTYKKTLIVSLRWQVALMMMIPIAYIDFKEKIIPNKILIIGITFTVSLLLIQGMLRPNDLLSLSTSAIGGALVASGIFFISSIFVKNGVGAGDIKMHFVLGLLVGFVGIFNILLYSMIISAVTGIALMVLKKKNSKDFLPLAPFTLLGVILAIVLGV